MTSNVIFLVLLKSGYKGNLSVVDSH